MGHTGARRCPSWLPLLPMLMFLLSSTVRGICPPRCECDDATLLASCEAASLEVVPIQLNPEVEVMRLRGNRIAHLDYSMDFYTRLRSLDVSGNKLQAFGPHIFQAQHRLVELNVSNNEVTSLAPETFLGLVSLRSLDLSGNHLAGVGDVAGVWRGLDNLWELDLSRNSLDALSNEDEPEDCVSLRNVRTLQLNVNHFTSVPRRCLSQLSSLRHLGMADNLLASLRDDSFPPSLHELVSIHLQGNQIAILAPGALDNLSSLQILDLSDNNLTYVPSAALSKLSSSLVELDLSGNPLTYVGPVAFQSLFELRRLRLSRLTELLGLDARAFVDNIRLEETHLEMCPQLKRLPPRIFEGNPLLTRVSLRGNALQTLSASDLPLAQIRHLALADNPFRCNCSLLWLWRIARDAVSRPGNHTFEWRETAGGAVCWEPAEIRGTPVSEAPEAQVDCEASWLTVLMVTAVVVSLFVLTCAILFYCGGGGRWCHPGPSDTPSSMARANGIKEQYPPLSGGNMYHQHHLMHHHHLGLPPTHHMNHVNMWSSEASAPPDLAADLTTRVPLDYEYTSDGLAIKKPPGTAATALGVYV